MQPTWTCPRCFQAAQTEEALEGFCRLCLTFTGLSPWRPEDGDTKCQSCRRPNPVWWIQQEIWNVVMPDDGILCPSCFIVRADAMGIGARGRGSWQLYPPAELSSEVPIPRPSTDASDTRT